MWGNLEQAALSFYIIESQMAQGQMMYLVRLVTLVNYNATYCITFLKYKWSHILQHFVTKVSFTVADQKQDILNRHVIGNWLSIMWEIGFPHCPIDMVVWTFACCIRLTPWLDSHIKLSQNPQIPNYGLRNVQRQKILSSAGDYILLF